MTCFLPLQTLSMCLILCFVTTEQASDIGKHIEFGCKFLNDQYETMKTLEPIYEKKPSGRICFSDSSKYNQTSSNNKLEIEIVPTETSGETSGARKEINLNCTTNEQTVLYTDHWNQFKSALSQSFLKTKNSHTLNDVDPFIRFITKYNAEILNRTDETKISMESFLNEYNVPYYSKENPAGFIIDLFHEMQRRNFLLKPYLVTAYIDPDLLNNITTGYPYLTKTRFQDHVAGVIQISYNNRLGYILVEPGYYNRFLMTPFAVVLMEDKKTPHGEFIFGQTSYINTFVMGDPSNMYIIVTHNQVSGVKHVVYYLGRAYCSFLDSTTKGDLLRSEHGISTFDSKAAGMGHVSFNIKESAKFSLGQWDNEDSSLKVPVLTVEYIPFSKIKQSSSLSKTKNTALNNYTALVFSSPSKILSKMQTLMREFFEAPDYNKDYNELKEELTTLANKYGREKPLTNVYIKETRKMIGIAIPAINYEWKIDLGPR